jgi:hypothetical protein
LDRGVEREREGCGAEALFECESDELERPRTWAWVRAGLGMLIPHRPFVFDEQELAQRDMSVTKKNQLRERFNKVQNAFAAEGKAQQAARGKEVGLVLFSFSSSSPLMKRRSVAESGEEAVVMVDG